jgi:hypothetical protein
MRNRTRAARTNLAGSLTGPYQRASASSSLDITT